MPSNSSANQIRGHRRVRGKLMRMRQGEPPHAPGDAAPTSPRDGGMKVTFLGTGVPVVSTERYGAAQVVSHGDARILIDCGSGVTQRMVAAGMAPRDLDVVLLTHLHSDHVMDAFQLIMSSWVGGRDRPLPIFGPPGTRRFVEGLMDAWRPELEQRIAHVGPGQSTAALQADVTEIGPGPVGTFGGVEVEAIEVDHRPVVHAYGFALQAEGQRVVFSGDTKPCKSLALAAKGADLLVHEVIVATATADLMRASDSAAKIVAYHTRSDVVGKIAADAGVGCLALTHIAPPNVDRGRLMDDVAADYHGPAFIAEDLSTIDVSSRRVTFAGGAVLALARR
ncbi:unnamed protein product [Ostreobium quekettii]|uniref:Metallo-beta-lactamase domain-containing protein n=1 Tax=Ostreobium quekettii TaxID=121088 RepID=A0A8S1JED3_9CHLO|nr:unnamed protein product [Ostreobium quekettii]|eukprot:evm.model.scf_1192EXC.2 EVM.evm.TU.scf_1192EXC.2   scf_1192EXC:14306-15316(-)